MFKDLIYNCTDSSKFIQVLLIFIILIIVQTLLIKYLWNNSLVKHISIFKPIGGFKEALLLAIGLSIIRG